MMPTSPIISNNHAQTTRSMVAVGALIVAASSVFIFHTCRRKQEDNASNHAAGSDESDVYKQLGISEENLPTHIQREIYKERKRKSKYELISMKTPMYDNVYMLDENREQVCTISLKKANWYVKKGIAEWSSFKDCEGSAAQLDNDEGEVKCIRLLFEHKGSKSKETTPETLYLRSAKQNICVSCGGGGNHIRHYIIPFSYRTLLPDQYKLHMSHDIVILCPDCHVNCDRQTKRRMKRMESDLRTKMGGDACGISPVIEDPHLSHVRSHAIALVRSRENMPMEKIEKYDKEVREYLASVCKSEEDKEALLNGKEELTKSQLQKACKVNYRVKNPRYIPGSEIVVGSLKDADSIEEFIIDWREHFIATVNPQHMPDGWRVDNPVVHGSWADSSFRLVVS